MFPEPKPTPDQEKPQEPSGDMSSSPFGPATTPQEPAFTPKPELVETPSPFAATHTPVASAPAPAVTAPAEADTYDSTALSLYIITILSGVSILVSASYLVYNALDYFTKPAPEYSFFDLSSLTIYALIYLVLFTTLYALASLRLDKRVEQAGSLERPLRTASAVWRALLVVWGVAAFVGLLYSPLSASLDGESSSLASEITSAIVGLVLIGLLFWRDLFVQKQRSGLIAVGVIAGIVVVIAGANAYASFNPKQPKEPEMPDYSSSMYNYNIDNTSNSSETTEEYNFNLESTTADDTTDTSTTN